MNTGTDASIDPRGPEVREISVDALIADPQWPTIAREYEAECGTSDMVQCNVNWDMYRSIESCGQLKAFGAFVNGTLVGYCFLVMVMHPKYSSLIGTTESIYVLREYRTAGVGLRLFRFVERMAHDLGAVAMLCSSGAESSMSKLMPALKYKHISNVFFKRFA